MKLKSWYQRHLLYPVLRLNLGLLVLIMVLNWFHFSREFQQKQIALTDLVSLAEFGYNQKNRDLVESVLNLSVTNLGATQFTMCDDGVALLSFPNVTDRCEVSTPTIRDFVVVKNATSNPKITFKFEFSRRLQWIYLLISLTLLVLAGLVFLFVMGRLKRKFEGSILAPLSQMSASKTEIDEIDSMLMKNRELEELRLKSALLKVASQVAHDIRSPLTGLNMIIGTGSELPEDKRVLLRAVSQRINDIANQLLSKSRVDHSSVMISEKSSKDELSAELLAPILEMVVAEKRELWRDHRDLKLEMAMDETFGATAQVVASSLKRVLSNLMNNSFEALVNRNGQIVVSLKKFGHRNVISVRDNGVGIPPAVLKQLGEKPLSYGKNNDDSGFGLGITYAKETIESFGGQLIIDSREGVGTEIRIELPSAKPPAWFVAQLNLKLPQLIIAVDDDCSVLEVWKTRFAPYLSSGLTLLTFQRTEEFLAWFKKSEGLRDQAMYFIDYEIEGSPMNGVDLIKSLGISGHSHLVTNRFEDLELRASCQSLNLKLLPKVMAFHLPIEVNDEKGGR